MRSDETKPQLTRKLLLRVLSYARAYRWQIAGMLVMILLTTGLTLLTPLIFRRMIDVVIPKGDLKGLVLLALALLLIPVFQGLVGVLQRRWNAEVGEGVIYDLRVALFSKLERMSLRFFTNTRIGELMSRLNNDVVGAQDAISNTIVSIVSNGIEAVALLAVMFALEWRLTLVGAAILPLFLLAADRLGRRMRALARRQMDLNAQMNAHMNETLNIGGALLVKLFGRAATEEERFSRRAAAVREAGIQRAVFGTAFFVIVGLVSAVGTAVVYGVGGYLVILKSFTVGTIVAFGSYLGSLYGTLQSLVNAPVSFSTSVVSFERVFEVIDLPEDIAEPADAVALPTPRGELVFDNVDFKYEVDENKLLSDVRRYGSLDAVTAV
ncbi:MAG TPA: ABC transporter ATP-binding protein, partial [Anaerolineales bacterium]